MPRYIDADALIISLAKDRSALVNNHVPHGELHRIDETIWKVVEAPTADAVPVVRGEWVAFDPLNMERPYNWVCSSCGYGCVDYRTTYCHDCGAKMESEGGT